MAEQMMFRHKFSLFIGKNGWTIFWGLVFFSIGLGVWSLTLLISYQEILSALTFAGLAGLLGGAAYEIQAVGLRNIPADPPHKGLVTAWGLRTTEKLDEGDVLTFPYWPVLYSAVLVNVARQNDNLTYEHVRCKLGADDVERAEETGTRVDPMSGGNITVRIGITYEVDPRAGKMDRFIQNGGHAGVISIVTDMLGEEVRQMGRERTWEEYTFATDRLTVKLIVRLVAKALPAGTTAETMTEAQIAEYLRDALEDGVSDESDLGIKVVRLNVQPIELEGELGEASSQAARERLERRGEEIELETDFRMADTMLRTYLSDEDYERLTKEDKEKQLKEYLMEVRRRRAIREGHGTIVDIPNLEHIARAIAGLLGRGGG